VAFRRSCIPMACCVKGPAREGNAAMLLCRTRDLCCNSEPLSRDLSSCFGAFRLPADGSLKSPQSASSATPSLAYPTTA
jgi:hypothetical protein